MIDWITKNYQWIFSGIGVLIVSFLITFLFKSKSKGKQSIQKQQSGKNSVNIQSTKDIKIKDSFKNEG